ncbi:MAG: DUF2157 domain-containing protein [Pseudomonadota bacterium]
MRVKKKLKIWQKNNLVTADQVEKILKFESKEGSNRFMRKLLWVGGFSILMGLISIIAANWQIIPPSLKLFVHFAINFSVATAAFINHQKGKLIHTDVCLTILWALTITFIALVGQIFQLDGSIPSAIFLWSLITIAPLAIFGRTLIALGPALVAFIALVVTGSMEYVFPVLSNDQAFAYNIGLFILLPMMFILLSDTLKKWDRPLHQNLMVSTSITAIIIGASSMCQLWYGRYDFESFTYYGLIILILVLATFASKYVAKNSYLQNENITQNVEYLLIGSFAISALSFIFISVEASFIAALSFIIYWIFLAYIFNKMHLQSLVTFAIAVVAIRIYVVYLELFGSLLLTGFGLIISGIVLIGMVIGVNKFRKTIISESAA